MDVSILLLILPGMIGGLVRGLVGVCKNVLKNKKGFDIKKILFSLITAIVVGGFASAITGGDWRIAALAGYAGADLLENLYKLKLLSIFR